VKSDVKIDFKIYKYPPFAFR